MSAAGDVVRGDDPAVAGALDMGGAVGGAEGDAGRLDGRAPEVRLTPFPCLTAAGGPVLDDGPAVTSGVCDDEGRMGFAWTFVFGLTSSLDCSSSARTESSLSKSTSNDGMAQRHHSGDGNQKQRNWKANGYGSIVNQ